MNDRPSAWLIGFGIGMAVTGGVLAGHVRTAAVVPQWWVFYPALIVTVTGIVVGLSGVGYGVAWGLQVWEKVAELRRPALPAVGAPPAPLDEEPDVDYEHAAKLDAMLTFFHAGEKAGGFSAGLLSPGVVGSDTWEDLTDFYISPEGRQVLRVVAGNVGTVWNHGHGLDSTIRGLRAGVIPLPPGEVPLVSAYVAPVAAQRSAPRKGTTKAPRVVDVAPSREA